MKYFNINFNKLKNKYTNGFLIKKIVIWNMIVL